MNVFQLSMVKQMLSFRGPILLHTSPNRRNNIFHKKQKFTLKFLTQEFRALFICIYNQRSFTQIKMIQAPMNQRLTDIKMNIRFCVLDIFFSVRLI